MHNPTSAFKHNPIKYATCCLTVSVVNISTLSPTPFLGSMDNTVRLWDATKAFDDLETDDFTAATGHIHLQDNSQELLLGTYTSKSTPVTHLHFTRRNLLLAAGAYNP